MISAFVVAMLVFLLGLPAFTSRFIALDDRLYVAEKPACDGLTAESVWFAFSDISRLYWHPCGFFAKSITHSSLIPIGDSPAKPISVLQ